MIGGLMSTTAEQQKLWWDKNPERYLFHTAKERAKKEGSLFTLTISDISIPEFCPYLNFKLVYRANDNRTSMTLDRINPNLGYISGNVEVISFLANRMKTNATEQELIQFAKSVLKRYKNETTA